TVVQALQTANQVHTIQLELLSPTWYETFTKKHIRVVLLPERFIVRIAFERVMVLDGHVQNFHSHSIQHSVPSTGMRPCFNASWVNCQHYSHDIFPFLR